MMVYDAETPLLHSARKRNYALWALVGLGLFRLVFVSRVSTSPTPQAATSLAPSDHVTTYGSMVLVNLNATDHACLAHFVQKNSYQLLLCNNSLDTTTSMPLYLKAMPRF